RAVPTHAVPAAGVWPRARGPRRRPSELPRPDRAVGRHAGGAPRGSRGARSVRGERALMAPRQALGGSRRDVLEADSAPLAGAALLVGLGVLLGLAGCGPSGSTTAAERGR